MAYLIAGIEGIPGNSRRGIAFLESGEDGRIDGKSVFDGLTEKVQRDLRSRIDLWLSGGTCDKYFHGWPNDKDHKHCFVFKWKQAGTLHRLYGFLCHPRNSTDPKFQACILVLHARKNTHDTDVSLLGLINTLRAKVEITAAVEAAFRR